MQLPANCREQTGKKSVCSVLIFFVHTQVNYLPAWFSESSQLDHLKWHQSSVSEKPQKSRKYDSPCDSSNNQDPLESTRNIKKWYWEVHAKYSSYHPKDSNNKSCSCEYQLKLYKLVPNVILKLQKSDSSIQVQNGNSFWHYWWKHIFSAKIFCHYVQTNIAISSPILCCGEDTRLDPSKNYRYGPFSTASISIYNKVYWIIQRSIHIPST